MSHLNFEPLKAELTRLKSTREIVVALLTQFAADVELHKNDPVELQAVVDGYTEEINILAAAAQTGIPVPPPA